MPGKAMRLRDALDEAAGLLAAAGVEQPRREARLLAAHVLQRGAGGLLDRDATIDAAAFRTALARRCLREPLAFITGRRGFWTLDLHTTPDTLIPRADSETLITASLAALPDRTQIRNVLDLGTGTGCLLLAALSEYQAASGIGVDLSPAACSLAARNAAQCGLAHRAAFLAGNWADALRGQFDLVLCNPPYIESAALGTLMPEVARYEPRRALDGGPGGLEAYARLIPDLPRLLAPNGAAVIEVGTGQADSVVALGTDAGLGHAATARDLSGIERAVVLGRPGAMPRMSAR